MNALSALHHAGELVQRIPYLLFLALVLFPVGVLAYVCAAVVCTVTTNARAGWRDHC